MKIAAIVVTYNPFKWIDLCLGSLSKSSFPLDIYVVDNCSTDSSQQIIKERYSYINLIQCETNLGFGQANNIGIKKAYDSGADFVFLLNQDAWVEENTIQILVDSLTRNKKYGIVSPIHLNGTGDAFDNGFSSYIIPEKCQGLFSDLYLNKIQKDIYEVAFVNAAAWLISRDCIETVGGFSRAFFHYGEDNNYVDRLKYHGLKIGICPNCRVYHDRENRINQAFFVGKNLDEKQLLLHYLNPNLENNIKKDLNTLKKNYYKCILFLKLKAAKENHPKIEFLRKNANMLISVLKESRNIKLAFLHKID